MFTRFVVRKDFVEILSWLDLKVVTQHSCSLLCNFGARGLAYYFSLKSASVVQVSQGYHLWFVPYDNL